MINTKYLPILVIASGLLALPASLAAQTSADTAKATKNASTSVQDLKASFSAQRQAMIKQRQELLQKLKAAKTSAERHQILVDAQKNDKALISAQHDLSKQIQNDIKEELLHDQHRGPPGG
jgi:hypothetical protein